jgi:hypothetical protein
MSYNFAKENIPTNVMIFNMPSIQYMLRGFLSRPAQRIQSPDTSFRLRMLSNYFNRIYLREKGLGSVDI